MVRILVFGASTTYGKCDPEGGWVQRLRKYIDENAENIDSNSVFNLGISGNTTEDLLRRFGFETKQRLKNGEESIFIISIGMNDAQYLHDKQSTKVSQEKFRANLRKIIQKAKKNSTKIIFVGFQPVDEQRVDPWKQNKSYKMEYIEKYDKIARKVCTDTNIHFIDILSSFKQSNYRKLLYDGLHPNSEGHRKIFELVRDFLNKQKLI